MLQRNWNSILKDAGVLLLNIVLAMLLGSIFVLLQGENPLQVYYHLLISPLVSPNGFIKVLGRATPLIFTGLAALICFRCELFNVGVEGQIYLGGLAGSLVLLFVPIQNHVLILVLAVLAAMVAGGLWGMLAGWLKVRFNVHEVISTIMLNYVATSIMSYVIVDHLKRADGNYSRSEMFTHTFTKLIPTENLNTGFILAIVAVVAILILVCFTATGWRIDAAGKNLTATRYAGINSGALVLIVMAVSGMLAGLCGIERVAGVYGYIENGFSPGYGYDGMIVAIIGRNNPIGALLTALFFGLLYTGGVTMNLNTNVPTEWVYVLIAIMFILVAAEDKILAGIGRGVRRLLRGKREVRQ